MALRIEVPLRTPRLGARSRSFLRREVLLLRPTTTDVDVDVDGVARPSLALVSPEDAANLIEERYRTPTTTMRPRRRLLVVSADASRGANRHFGLASVLRTIPSDDDEERDSIVLVTRRAQCADVVAAETDAVRLGVRTARERGLLDRDDDGAATTDVLLLSDSESAIRRLLREHGTGPGEEEEEARRDGRTMTTRRRRRRRRRRDRRSPSSLGDGDGGGGLLDGALSVAKVRSARGAVDGYFDHDVCDAASSAVRTVSNRDNAHRATRTRATVPRLRPSDAEWLRGATPSTYDKGRGDVNAARLARRAERLRDEWALDDP